MRFWLYWRRVTTIECKQYSHLSLLRAIRVVTLSQLTTSDVLPRSRGRFNCRTTALDGLSRGESKGLCKPYARVHSSHQILLQHHGQGLFIRSRHHQVSFVHQELSVTSSIAQLNDIKNRTQIQSSLLVPSSMLTTLHGRAAGPGLVRSLNRVAQSAPEDANSGTIVVLTLREVRVLQSEIPAAEFPFRSGTEP